MKGKQNRVAATAAPKVAIYCRVSTVSQEEEGTSLDTQEAHCRQYAIAKGYQIDEQHVYRETYSGAELWERPRLTPLRAALRQGAVQDLIAYAIDRLSRDPVHLGVIISEAEYHGAQVEFVTEPIDKSPEGQLIRFVRGYAAQVEREKIRERALRGKLARVQSGKIQTPPDLVVKFKALILLMLFCAGYDDHTSCINGKSRRERPSPSEALRLPLNPGECGSSFWGGRLVVTITITSC
jgi:DNA invertase Pin-like site-specific DNA recombinase